MCPANTFDNTCCTRAHFFSCVNYTKKYTESTNCNHLSWKQPVCVSPLGLAEIVMLERMLLCWGCGETYRLHSTHALMHPAPDACYLHNGCLTAIVKLSGKCCFNFHVNCNGQIVNIFWTQSGTIKWDLGRKHVEIAWWIIKLTKEVMFEKFICLNI